MGGPFMVLGFEMGDYVLLEESFLVYIFLPSTCSRVRLFVILICY